MRQSRLVRNLIAVLAALFIVASCSSTRTSGGATPEQTPSSEATSGEDEADDDSEIEAVFEAEPEPERAAVPAEAVTIKVDNGPGWRLDGVEVDSGHPYGAVIATSDRALDRAADDSWFETRPSPDFAEEVVIVLAPSVSGSCPDIIFDGLSIADGRVFGFFEPGPPPENTTVCTADANPIAFVFVVERQALPELFTLSVEEDVRCEGCERAETLIDLDDEAALELALWGTGTFDIVIDGTSPAEGTANVFRWADEAALMLPADAFTSLPRWIQGFPGDEAMTIEAFVVDCGQQGCAEECDDESCQDLTPLGNVCSYRYEPEPFVDRTATITWTDMDCEITSAPQGANG